MNHGTRVKVAESVLLITWESKLLECLREKSEILVYFVVEAEKKREAKQRAKEAQERELRKREKAEEKERRRKEYDALKAAKREQEKKPKKEANQAPSKFSACCEVPAGVQWRHSCF